MPETALQPLTAVEAVSQLATMDIVGPSQLVAVAIAEASDGMPLWWLSYVDPEIAAQTPGEAVEPGGPAFLGATIVPAPDLYEAFGRTHELGINPGGQVQIAGPIPAIAIDGQWCDRLLSGDEAKAVPDPQIEIALDPFTPSVPDGVCPGCGHASYFKRCGKCGTERA